MTVLQEDLDFLEHAGVKGMKWGVRRNRRAQAFAKRGAGKANLAEKAYVQTHLGLIDRAKGHGTKGGAARKGARLLGRNARVQSGKASAKDLLLYYGTTKQKDLVPVRSKNQHISDPTRKALSAATATGALMVTSMLIQSGSMQAIKHMP